jgi:hypothetical protein
MIYRILIDDIDPTMSLVLSLRADDRRLPPHLAELQAHLGHRPRLRLRGAQTFGTMMEWHGLRAPTIAQPRARFYFTERGWAQVGRHVAAAARQEGHVVKVIRRKEPRRSQIVYRDTLQVALLPGHGAKPVPCGSRRRPRR